MKCQWREKWQMTSLSFFKFKVDGGNWNAVSPHQRPAPPQPEVGFRLGRTGKQGWNSDVQKSRPERTAVRGFGSYVWWERPGEDLRLCYAVLQEAVKCRSQRIWDKMWAEMVHPALKGELWTQAKEILPLTSLVTSGKSQPQCPHVQNDCSFWLLLFLFELM